MVAHYLESPYERPAVGMELGGGDVELGEELPFKASEGKPKFHLLEQGGVYEAEQPAVGEARPLSSIAELPQQSLQKMFSSTKSRWPMGTVF